MWRGMLLAGVGHVDVRQPGRRNYFTVDTKTPVEAVEEAFREMVARRDVAILLITQSVADTIRGVVDAYAQTMPALLEIPSKDVPYSPEKDSVMRQVNRLFSAD